MDKLMAMRVFVTIARQNSFSGAASKLGLSRAKATRYVKFLESDLGVRLLNRSTRRLSLTSEGAAYVRQAQEILESIETLEQTLSTSGQEPRGLLRVSAPNTFGVSHVSTAVARYIEQYPKVTVHLELSNRMVDLVEEGFDVAIRMGPLKNSSLIARHVTDSAQVVCGAPRYFEQNGVPRKPADLKRHNCLRYTQQAPTYTWRLSRNGRTYEVPTSGDFEANAAAAMIKAAVAGRGIVLLPEHLMMDELRSGRLIKVLTDYQAPVLPVHVMYLQRRYLSARIRTFVDFLVDYDFST